MSRKFITSIEKIFWYLESKIYIEDKPRIIDAKKRLIYPPHESLMESNGKVLSNTNIKSKILINDKESVYGLTLEEKSYVLMPGTSELEDIFSPGFSTKISDADDFADGLKLLAMSEMLIPLKPDIERSLKLIDKIFGLGTNEKNEIYYYIDQIVSFYTEFEVWEVDSEIYNINVESDLYRLYIIWRISNEKDQGEKHGFALNFSYGILEQLVKLSQNQNSKYISKVLFRAITSTNWEHCYLELYRCLENLYTVYHIDYLKGRLHSDTLDIANSLEGMGFKSREVYDVTKIFGKININQHLLRDLKEKVFELDVSSSKIDINQEVLSALKEAVIKQKDSTHLDMDLLNRLREGFKKVKNNSDDLLKINKQMAEKLYTIRCNIAHLKYRHDHVNFNENQWQRIIFVILNIIEELYDLFGERLEELSL